MQIYNAISMMNKNSLIIVSVILLLCSGNTTAINHQERSQTIYGRYGIQYQESREDYKKYMGREFAYMPESTDLFKLRLFPYDKYHKTYFINYLNAFKKLSIGLCPTDNIDKISKIKVDFIDSEQSVRNLPLVFMDLIETELEEAKGKSFSREGVKNTFTIVDTKFEKLTDKSTHKSIVYYIRDDHSGNTHRISNMDEDYTALPRILYKHRNLASLVSVEKSSGSSKQNGKVKKEIQKDSLAFAYSDSLLSVVIVAGYSDLYFIIKNNSNNSIKVYWNEASFVGTDGFTSKIMHSGIKYIEREKMQTPTTIIAGASLADCVVPINNVELVGNDWKERPLFDHTTPIYEAQYMKLMLPILVNGVMNEYLFTFKVCDEYTFPGVIKNEEVEPTIPNNYYLPYLIDV